MGNFFLSRIAQVINTAIAVAINAAEIIKLTSAGSTFISATNFIYTL